MVMILGKMFWCNFILLNPPHSCPTRVGATISVLRRELSIGKSLQSRVLVMGTTWLHIFAVFRDVHYWGVFFVCGVQRQHGGLPCHPALSILSRFLQQWALLDVPLGQRALAGKTKLIRYASILCACACGCLHAWRRACGMIACACIMDACTCKMVYMHKMGA